MELKKFRNYLKKNQWWICETVDCWKHSKDIYHKCSLIKLIDYSCAAKEADSNTFAYINTFANSIFNDVFLELYFDYFKPNYYKEKTASCCRIL